MSPEIPASPWQRPPSDTPSRPWFKVWPPHLPHALDYPLAPAWWILERNLDRHPERIAIRYLAHDTLAERETLTYAALAPEREHWRWVCSTSASAAGHEWPFACRTRRR